MSERDRQHMRGLLRTVGITLDEPKPIAVAADVVEIESAPPDPAEVRAILVDAGAPESDLDWLVASCPSIEHAYTYRAPTRDAWCAKCQGVRACDGNGCIVCRAEEPCE